MPLGVQYSGVWTLSQQFQAVGAGTWKNIPTFELYTWGRNGDGELGLNATVNKSSPTQVGALITWSNIAGGRHSMATKTDGTLWVWGVNNYGQLGLNDRISRSSPVQVGSDTNWSNIAGSQNHSMATKTNGTLYKWGDNENGQLGLNDRVYRSSPTQVGALTTWTSNLAINSFSHSLAILNNVTADTISY